MKEHQRAPHADQSWVSFWKDGEGSSRLIIEVSTLVAASRLERAFKINAPQEVLDFGCGPAFLCDHLARKGVSVVGADLNPAIIALNREKYPAIPFVLINASGETTESTLAKELGPRRFDHIILLSVVQYLGDIGEVTRLVGILIPFLKKGGKLIVADVIDSRTRSAIDAAAAFYHAFRKGRPFALLYFAKQLTGWRYRTTASRHNLLKVDAADMAQIAKDYHLKVSAHANLTAHPTRKTYSFER